MKVVIVLKTINKDVALLADGVIRTLHFSQCPLCY